MRPGRLLLLNIYAKLASGAVPLLANLVHAVMRDCNISHSEESAPSWVI